MTLNGSLKKNTKINKYINIYTYIYIYIYIYKSAKSRTVYGADRRRAPSLDQGLDLNPALDPALDPGLDPALDPGLDPAQNINKKKGKPNISLKNLPKR